MTLIGTRPRRLVLAALAAAVLGTLTLLALTPPKAAAGGLCAERQFCLLMDLSLHSGLYRYSGSDGNLHNDRYLLNHTHTIVGNSSTAAWNRGERGTYDDVVIYDKIGFRRPLGCILRGHNGQLPLNLFQRVSSYQWVTDSRCRAAGVIWLPGSIKW
jgi:hypothetical protein